ncbi:MAG: hypothetical protein J7599_06520 [Niabella sp.]|nr:hypothetical protein [Niabella sp.]
MVSIVLALFWLLCASVNMYRYAITGAVFELLSLPSLAGALFIMIVSVIILFKRSTRKLFPVLSILILVGTFLYTSYF